MSAPSQGVSQAIIVQAVMTGGATPQAFTDPINGGGNALDIVNDTGVDIEYIRTQPAESAVSTLYLTIPAGGARLVVAINKASDISIRRKDQAATSTTVKAELLRG